MSEGAFVAKMPLFAGALAFLNACGEGGSAQTTAATTSDTSGTGQELTTTETGPIDSSTSSSSGDASSDAGAPQCVMCSAEPPEGWIGPVAYARVTPGNAPPECPDAVAEKGPTVLDGFNPPPPTSCECSCQLEGGGGNDCYIAVITGEPAVFATSGGYGGTGTGGTGYGGTSYGGGGYGGTGVMDSGGDDDSYDCDGESYALTPGCINLNVDGKIRFNVVSYEGYGYGASCMETSSETIPPVSWTAEIATCRLPTVTPMCDGGEICIPPLPEGFESNWCLYKDGDAECPAGPYSNKTVFWTDVDDTRTCSTCACGSSGMASCGDIEIYVYADPDCAGEPVASVPATEQCVDATGQSVAMSAAAEPQCLVTQMSEPEGDVAATGAFTFCCTE